MNNLIEKIKQEPEEIRELIAKFHYENYWRDLLEKTRHEKMKIICVMGLYYDWSFTDSNLYGALLHKCIHDVYDVFLPSVYQPKLFKEAMPYSNIAIKDLSFSILPHRSRLKLFNSASELIDRMVIVKQKELTDYYNFLLPLENE